MIHISGKVIKNVKSTIYHPNTTYRVTVDIHLNEFLSMLYFRKVHNESKSVLNQNLVTIPLIGVAIVCMMYTQSC